MGGYSHLFPSGQFPRFILVSFVCTCIMLCLCRAMHLAACVTCIIPVLYAVLARRLHHLRCTCRVRGAGGPETSRDHLLDRTIKSARIFCARTRFLYKSFLRANFVVENRSPANIAVRHLRSNRAVDYCVHVVETI